MNDLELSEFLDNRGYRLVRVVRFKNCDRIHWEHKTKDFHGTWTTASGWHLERLKPEYLEPIFP